MHFDAAPEDRTFAGLHVLLQAGAVLVAERLRDDQCRHLFPSDLLAPVAEGLLGCRIEVQDVSSVVHRDDAVQGGFQDRGLASFALSYCLFDPVASDELTDLPAERGLRFHQLVVGVSHLPREGFDHTDNLVPDRDWEGKSTVETELGRDARTREAGLQPDIRDPDRMALLPAPTGEALAAREASTAGGLFEFTGI